MARWLIAEQGDAGDASESEESEESEVEDGEEIADEAGHAAAEADQDAPSTSAPAARAPKISIKLSGAPDVCHVSASLL